MGEGSCTQISLFSAWPALPPTHSPNSFCLGHAERHRAVGRVSGGVDDAIKVWAREPRIHSSHATDVFLPWKVIHSPLKMLTFHTPTWKITNTKNQNNVFHSGYQQGTDGSFKLGNFKEGLFTKGLCENVGKDKEYCCNLGLIAVEHHHD